MSERFSGALQELIRASFNVGPILRAFVFLVLIALMTFKPVQVAHSQTSQQCWALEQELAASSNSPRQNSSQLRSLNNAIQRQQRELDKVRRQHAQFECRSSGFLIFQRRQAPQCRTIQARMDRMTDNLDSLTDERSRLTRGDVSDRDPVRLRILQALGRFNCGPQYRRYAPRGRTNFSIFGRPEETHRNNGPYEGQSGRRLLGNIPTYRTMCVRTCDGYRFPVSFATLPSRFEDDAAQCASMCPTAETELYIHPNPGGSDQDLTTVDGRNYTSLPNAWRYQTEVVPKCSCDATTLQLEASEENRRVAAIGADDATPADVTQLEVSDDTDRVQRSFQDTPTVELKINFDDPDAQITEQAANADPAGPTISPDRGSNTENTPKQIIMIEADGKPPFEQEADYHPNRIAGSNDASDRKNLR